MCSGDSTGACPRLSLDDLACRRNPSFGEPRVGARRIVLTGSGRYDNRKRGGARDGSSGDRATRPVGVTTAIPSHYLKLYLPVSVMSPGPNLPPRLAGAELADGAGSAN